MDLNIFNVEDKSGKMAKESYVSKNHTEEYNYIIDKCKLEIPFKEKVYIVLNDLNGVPKCENINCDNEVKFKNTTLGYSTYCSNKCIGSDPNMILRKEIKSIEKFGTKAPSQSKEIKDKIIKTNNTRYGGNSAMSSKEIQEKSRQTLMKNHGVTCPSHSEEILKRRIETFKLGNYKETYKKTSLERYGVEHPWMCKEVHQKTINPGIETKNLNLIDRISKKLENIYTLIDIDFTPNDKKIIIHCDKCNDIFTINIDNFKDRNRIKTKICTICNPINSNNISGKELELLDMIKLNYNGEIITNSRDIIKPLEIDIYLPTLNLAFEFNGLYWHSENKRGKYPHVTKYKKCLENNIELVNIWEDDWDTKRDIIKSFIENKLGYPQTELYIENCEVRIINEYKITRKFLNDNDILGHSNSNIKIGLYHNNELVSLMTFSGKNGSYKMTRFCNKINYCIIGSDLELFNYFLKKYSPNNIISYSDNSMTKGDIYEKLGFRHISDTRIDYKWVFSKNIRENKSKYKKDRLVKMGYDPNKTEDEIMIQDMGGFKIWDCGFKKWLWEKS